MIKNTDSILIKIVDLITTGFGLSVEAASVSKNIISYTNNKDSIKMFYFYYYMNLYFFVVRHNIINL
jgi:hypothetical protein